MVLPVTTALGYDEPARTQAIEWLIEERVRTAVEVKGPNRKAAVPFVIGKDRRGRKRLRNITPGETFMCPANEAVQLLHKYGRGQPVTTRGPEGQGLTPRQQTYLQEVELADNAELVMTLNRDGTFFIPDRDPDQYDDADYEPDPYEEVDLSDTGDEDEVTDGPRRTAPPQTDPEIDRVMAEAKAEAVGGAGAAGRGGRAGRGGAATGATGGPDGGPGKAGPEGGW